MTTVNPFFYSNAAKDTFYFVTDLPQLGYIHLSQLSIDELKGLAQFFNLMAAKHGNTLTYKLLAITSVGIAAIGAFAMVFTARHDVLFTLSLLTCIAGIGGAFSAFLRYASETTNYNYYTEWKNYTLEMIDLQINN